MITDEEKYNQALGLQKEAKYWEALVLADQISDPILRAGILIDSGTGVRKPGIIREGIGYLEAAVKAELL
jgi:hypothetical protein